MSGRQSHGRQAHGRSLTTQPKQKHESKKSKARSRNTYLDAFGIASKQFPQITKRTRAERAEYETGKEQNRGRNKATHDDDDEEEEDGDEDDDDAPPKKKRARVAEKAGSDHGSDSEGNEWRLGGMMEGGDDEEIESDDAFGESDEERFQDFTFRGGKAMQKRSAEDGSDAEDDEGEDDDDMSSLGEEAIDLSTALDQAMEESEEGEGGEEGEGELDSEDDEGSTPPSSEDEDDGDEDEDEDERLSSLKGLVSGFADQDEDADKPKSSRQKIDLKDLGLFGGAVTDAQMKKSMRLMSKEAKETRTGATKKLAVPLAQRQQDRVDRSAAYDKTKQTLERWTETVKHNRRAEHLVYPLPQNMPMYGIDTTELPTLDVKDSTNELEQTIASIMEKSGLSLKKPQEAPKPQDAEDAAQAQLSAAELRAMMNRKRLGRELNSREASRTKRIKKIKSKSYHRVHRREAERNEQKRLDAAEEAGEGGIDLEEEREAFDKQRALERVGGRHRNSKWAKSGSNVKRAAWDDEYRAGLVDMQQREQELLRRKEGKTGGSDEGEDGGAATEDEDVSGSEGSDDEDGHERRRLRKELERAARTDDGPQSRLMGLKFMKRAEEALKKSNDDLVEQMRKELRSDDEDEEDELPQEVGRKKFGQNKSSGLDDGLVSSRGNTRDKSDRVESISDSGWTKVKTYGKGRAGAEMPVSITGNNNAEVDSGDPWSKAAESRKQRTIAAKTVGELDLTGQAESIAGPPKRKTAKARTPAKGDVDVDVDMADANASTQIVLHGANDDDDSDAGDTHHELAIKDQKALERAFAGDDVDLAFEAEKNAVIADEEDKYIDNSVPGWGSWGGQGVKKKKKGPVDKTSRWVTKVEGVKRKDRKDAKLAKVIINEKTIKKHTKYLATQLPHPFENRQQYERSLRLPVGPEWVTTESFQDATKPRILLKQGVIEPIAKPII